jgi:quinol monooxygenase YgiN
MSVSFLAAGAGAAVAAVITGILVWRCARLPRMDQAAWACAALGLTAALAAQALGYHQGFNPVTFRAIQVGARLVAPMALIWGLAELTAKSFVVRFAARLGIAALTVIAGVILVADPLSGVTFTTAWPASDTHYQFIPHVVLLALAAATAVPALIALIVAAVRARREPGWRDAFLPVASAAVAALLTEGLQVKLPVKSGYAAICVAAAALTWLAGERSRRLQLPALHEMRAPDDDTGWGEAYTDGKGYSPYRPDTGGFGRVGSDTDFGSLYRPDTGESRPVSGDTDSGGLHRPDTGDYGPGTGDYRRDTGDFEEVGSDTGYGFYRTDTDLRPVVNGGPNLPRNEPVPGIIETGDILPVAFDVFTPAARKPDSREEETERLYGQIAIYTLIDGQAEEFDRLAQDVVEKVKALEPDTLAYIVHGVPSAPLQRILYEVYRDEAAFAEHGHQPYIQEFEEERKPYILATNVIELGVRQAKLSPLGNQPGVQGRPAPPDLQRRPAPPDLQRRPAQPDPQHRPPQPDPQHRPPQPDQQRRASQQDRPSPQGPADQERRPSPKGPADQERRPSPKGPADQERRPSPKGPADQERRPNPKGPADPQRRPSPKGPADPQRRPNPKGPLDPQRRPSQQGQPRPPDLSGPQSRPGPQDRPGPQGRPSPPVQPDQHVRSGLYGRPRPPAQPGAQDPSDPQDQPGHPWEPPDDEPVRRRSNGAR